MCSAMNIHTGFSPFFYFTKIPKHFAHFVYFLVGEHACFLFEFPVFYKIFGFTFLSYCLVNVKSVKTFLVKRRIISNCKYLVIFFIKTALFNTYIIISEM